MEAAGSSANVIRTRLKCHILNYSSLCVKYCLQVSIWKHGNDAKT
jgi:hypothetical protein